MTFTQTTAGCTGRPGQTAGAAQGWQCLAIGMGSATTVTEYLSYRQYMFPQMNMEWKQLGPPVVRTLSPLYPPVFNPKSLQDTRVRRRKCSLARDVPECRRERGKWVLSCEPIAHCLTSKSVPASPSSALLQWAPCPAKSEGNHSFLLPSL